MTFGGEHFFNLKRVFHALVLRNAVLLVVVVVYFCFVFTISVMMALMSMIN